MVRQLPKVHPACDWNTGGKEKTERKKMGILAENFPELIIDTITKIKRARRIANKINNKRIYTKS